MTLKKDTPERPFVDRAPTAGELELLRLSLSTFQDGSGQLKVKSGTLPGWRDFERIVVELTQGVGTENKSIFDVLVPLRSSTSLVGLSCKMRRELSRIDRDGRVTIELSNSHKKMWEALGQLGIDAANYRSRTNEVGTVLVNLVKQWHQVASTHKGYPVDILRSSYLALMWEQKTRRYQLYKFSLILPDPSTLRWYFTASSKGKGHLNGDDSSGGRVFEWYGESGGQLKYYPLGSDAVWQSPVFVLEPLPAAVKASLAVKVAAYFPTLWEVALSSG